MGDLGPVLVTGGCGLLGHAVVEALLASGNTSHITVFDIAIPPDPKYVDNPHITYFSGSVTSRDDLTAALQHSHAEVIIHTASPDGFTSTPTLLKAVNIHGTENVIACALAAGVQALVYTSSSGVVQSAYEPMLNIDETAPHAQKCMAESVYGRTKQIAETMVLEANGRGGLHTAALRPATIFGEGGRNMIPQAVEMARDGRVHWCIGDGRNLYDFIYADNAAEAHVLAAMKLMQEARSPSPTSIPSDQRVSGEAFFISNDEPIPFWDFIKRVAREIEKPVKEEQIWHIPMGAATLVLGVYEWVHWAVTLGGRPGITRDMLRYTAQVRTFDVGKAKERLGYRPRVGMEEGIRRAVRWFLEQEGKGEKRK